MAYTLEVNHPDFPKKTEFDLDGILVKNGEPVKVDKEMEELFLSHNGRSLEDIYGGKGGSGIVTLSGTSALKSGGES
jgi:hypothetical protein